MKHHQRNDLGIQRIISTGRVVFESTNHENDWSDHAHMEELVTTGFAEQSFANHVELGVDDSTFNVLRISASVEHSDEFNEAVDWTLEFMKNHGWVVEYLI
ncbi:hypothetical protein CHUUTOTORO_02030 [Serratia phage vB_SmaM-ChuuTotoro]|nr:hypothetical protein CHUUTOTORO_02030 [Serratia phage vB_SmaM-ChuuTotoro]